MIRRFSLILGSVFLFVNISAQDLTGTNKIKNDLLKRTFIGLQAGAAIPFSEFASKDFNNTVSGYANTGYNINVNLRYSFMDNFAVVVKYFTCNNPFDSKTFEKDINSYAPAYGHTFSSDAWQINGFLFAPTYLIRLSKFNIEIGLGVGNIFSTLPSHHETISNSSGTSTSTFSATDSNNWGFSFDLAFRYRIYKDLVFSLQNEVFVSDQTYRNISPFTNLPTVKSGSNYLQPYRIINLTAGIGFQFD